jgi:hypothetical protein
MPRPCPAFGSPVGPTGARSRLLCQRPAWLRAWLLLVALPVASAALVTAQLSPEWEPCQARDLLGAICGLTTPEHSDLRIDGISRRRESFGISGCSGFAFQALPPFVPAHGS